MVEHALTVGHFARRQATRGPAVGLLQAIEQGKEPLTGVGVEANDHAANVTATA